MEDKAEGRITRGQWLAMLAAVLGWMFDGFEMGLHPLTAKPAFKELLTEPVTAELSATGASPTQADIDAAVGKAIGDWNSYCNALFLFGAAAGGLVFGWLGDRIGRTSAMVWSVLAYTLFTGLGGFATAAWHLAVFRFIAALGMGGEWSLGVALVMEVWPDRFRPYLAGVIGAAANLGFLLIALVSVGITASGADTAKSWRLLMFCGVAPAALTFVIRLFVPESEKWKEAVGAVSRPDAAAPPAPPPILSTLFSGALLPRMAVAIGLSSVALLATWGAVQWMPLWAGDVAKKAGVQTPYAPALLQISSALGASVGTFLAAVFAGRIGRRPAYFLLCVASLAATGWLWRATPEYGPVFFFAVFLVGMTTASFYGWIPLYLPELFPTRVRATGQGLAFNFGRIFAGIGNLTVTAPLLAYYGGDYAQAMAGVALVYLVGMALIWLGPETRGRPLPE
jgi:MFS family permease